MTILKNKISDDLRKKFSSYLEERLGLQYTKERWGDLEKKMIPASKQMGYNNLMDCILSLMNGPLNEDLIAILAYHLTIGETYFFRDSPRMETLEKDILPEIISRHDSDRKIRIWSAGCCTGEEVYSIAIMLHRLIPNLNKWDISIIGSDINKEFLRKAQLGNYRQWSFRATPHEVQAKYFTEHKDGLFSLLPKIKQMVKISYFNLIDDSFSDSYKNMDLILCHNVLIYFSPRQIENTIHKLTSGLISDGWLSISATETPFVKDPHLSTKNFEGAVFFKKTEFNQNERIIPSKPIKHEPKIPINENIALFKVVFPDFIKLEQPVMDFHIYPENLKEEILQQEVNIDFNELYQRKKYREIVSILKPLQNDPEFFKDNSERVLMLIRTYANLGNLSDGLALCNEALKEDQLNINLHYMHATIHLAQGDLNDSIKSFKKALFLEPNYVAAYYMLGTVELQEKNYKEAARNFRTVLELIQDFEPDEELLGAEELTVSKVRDLIENALKRYQ